MTEAYGWHGRNVIDSAGAKVGTIDQIYEDERTGRPEWALVRTGLFGTRSHYVPLVGASPSGEDVQVQVANDLIKAAPSIDTDQELSQGEERRLFEHYERRGQFADEAMTRSEEELRVGTRRRESGRVRLRKYVITEEVTRTVPVQREEVRLEREPVTDANRGEALEGPEISEQQHEVILHEEELVVEKRAVPKERVRLGTDVVEAEREVSEQIRKEQIEIEGTGAVESEGQRSTDR